MPADLAAVLFSLAAALFFGIMPIFSKRGMAYFDAQTGSLITIGTVAAVYSVLAPGWMRVEYFFTPGFWVFFLNGFIHPTFSMYMSYEATQRVGPTISTTLAATTPFWASGIALLLLGEHLTLLIAIGTVLTCGGVVLLTWSGKRIPRLMVTALLFATGAALVRAVNQNLGRYGLSMLPVPIMAGWVSFSLGFALSVVGYRVAKGRLPLRIHRRGLAWCMLGGLSISAAIFCMYSALNKGQVVVVTPIIAANPVFTLLTALVFRQEVLTLRIVLGVAVTLGGVVLVTLG